MSTTTDRCVCRAQRAAEAAWQFRRDPSRVRVPGFSVLPPPPCLPVHASGAPPVAAARRSMTSSACCRASWNACARCPITPDCTLIVQYDEYVMIRSNLLHRFRDEVDVIPGTTFSAQEPFQAPPTPSRHAPFYPPIPLHLSAHGQPSPPTPAPSSLQNRPPNSRLRRQPLPTRRASARQGAFSRAILKEEMHGPCSELSVRAPLAAVGNRMGTRRRGVTSNVGEPLQMRSPKALYTSEDRRVAPRGWKPRGAERRRRTGRATIAALPGELILDRVADLLSSAARRPKVADASRRAVRPVSGTSFHPPHTNPQRVGAAQVI